MLSTEHALFSVILVQSHEALALLRLSCEAECITPTPECITHCALIPLLMKMERLRPCEVL